MDLNVNKSTDFFELFHGYSAPHTFFDCIAIAETHYITLHYNVNCRVSNFETELNAIKCTRGKKFDFKNERKKETKEEKRIETEAQKMFICSRVILLLFVQEKKREQLRDGSEIEKNSMGFSV